MLKNHLERWLKCRLLGPVLSDSNLTGLVWCPRNNSNKISGDGNAAGMPPVDQTLSNSVLTLGAVASQVRLNVKPFSS